MIQIHAGFSIGYRLGSPLCAAPVALALGAGTHPLTAGNGRGKTTLLRTLCGTLPPLSGGFVLRSAPVWVCDGMEFDPGMTPSEVFRALAGRASAPRARRLAEEMELPLNTRIGRLSLGGRRKTALLLAELLVRPGGVTLLDEPLGGVDAAVRGRVLERWARGGEEVCRVVACHPEGEFQRRFPGGLRIENRILSLRPGRPAAGAEREEEKEREAA